MMADKDTPDAPVTTQPAEVRRGHPTSAGIRLAVLIFALLLCGSVVLYARAVAANAANVEASSPQDMNGADDFRTFLHNSPKHASLQCAACHQRAADNAVQPKLPGHKACTNCHLPQFVSQNVPLCAICHTGLENNRNPPVKGFPGIKSFNARFDHAQHNTGAARPAQGCVACHLAGARRGVAQTIPASLGAHAQCYSCHTPNARAADGRDLASCGVCHQQSARFVRTSTNARAFNASFSHAEHGRRQGLNCADCHNLRAGLPQSRQVSAPLTAQHFGSGRAQSCMSCHNGRRAFGDADFNDCRRCHKSASFRMS